MKEAWLQIRKSLDAIHGHLRSDMVVRAVLWEVSVQLGREVELFGRSQEIRKMKEEPFFVHVEAAARSIISLQSRDRLDVINSLMGSVSGFDSFETWITAPAADQIADFAADAHRVRCAFGWSLHPALKIAIRAMDEGRPISVTFVAPSADVCEFAALCSTALEVDLEIVRALPFARPDRGPYDVEISLPPFNWNISSMGSELPQRTLDVIGQGFSGRLHSEPVAIADALEHATSARAILGLTAGALFRAVGVEAATRQELLKSCRLRAVLGVPSGMIYAETGIATSVLVIAPEKDRSEAVRFIDLGDEQFSTKTSRGRFDARLDVRWKEVVEGSLSDSRFARDVTLKEIEAQGGILTVDRYLRAGDEKLTTFLARNKAGGLAEVVELIRPVALPKVEDGSFFARECSPGDIAENGYLRPSARVVPVDRGGLRKARNQQLLPGDLVLSVKGTIGRVGLVPDTVPGRDADDFWTVGQSMMILRPNGRLISSEVLYEYLSSELMQGYLRALAGGAVIQQINMQDLKALPVPLPPKDQQEEIRKSFRARQELHAEVHRLQKAIRDMRNSGWPDGPSE